MSNTSPAPRSSARWVIKGVTDDCTTCDCCGRSNLKRTVALIPLDEDGNEDGDAVYYGTACAAMAMRRRTTSITNAANAARAESSGRDEHAREVISVFGPFEFATAMEQADVWWSRNPRQIERSPGEYIAEMLTRARAQLSDTTLGPARPHTVGDFRPFLVVADVSGERVHFAREVPREGAREFQMAVIRDARWRSRRTSLVFVTVYALSADGARQVVYTRHAIEQRRAARAAF
ncbi:hypothetical protein OG897_32420 [Streptomyces sp. NBC_00237]|uniref:hypothetical protein n=1 Tax=Streptomyces sp. NBC_00237 TaxID=2975687 RepID=UPI002257B6EC|nr:hypothetical protein [Streptomyces sp. NBC_00237]MCX5206104.1 hypothetical protein [Streptomyces sp. NBC_00237]